MLLFKRYALIKKVSAVSSNKNLSDKIDDENALLASCEWAISDTEKSYSIGEGETSLLKILTAWNPENIKLECIRVPDVVFNGWTVHDLAAKLWKQRSPDPKRMLKTWSGNCNRLCDGIAASLIYMATMENANEIEVKIVSAWLEVAISMVKHGCVPSFFDSLTLPHLQKHPALPDIMFSVTFSSFDVFCNAVERGVYVPSLSNVLQFACCCAAENELSKMWVRAAHHQLHLIQATHPEYITNDQIRPGLFAQELDPSNCKPRYSDLVAGRIMASLCVSVFSGKKTTQHRQGPGIPLVVFREGRCELETGPLKWISPPNPEASIFVEVKRESLNASCFVYTKQDSTYCWLAEAKMLKNSVQKIGDAVVPPRIDVYATSEQLILRKNGVGFVLQTNKPLKDQRWSFVSEIFATTASRTLSYSFANFRDMGIRLLPLLPCIFPRAVNHGSAADQYGELLLTPNHQLWKPITISLIKGADEKIEAQREEIEQLKLTKQNQEVELQKKIQALESREKTYLDQELKEDKVELEQKVHALERDKEIAALRKKIQTLENLENAQSNEKPTIEDTGESIKIKYYIPPEKFS